MARIEQSASTGKPSARVADPPPVRPVPPLPMDCCESGCDRCVFETYADELAFYEAALSAWRARQPDGDPVAG